MEDSGTIKRLAAILAADMVGYSRLMEGDEQATEAALDEARVTFGVHVGAQGGRVVDMAGDSVLATFPTAAGALAAALATQEELNRRTDDVPAARRVYFRVGVHLGDIAERTDGKIFGEGVNIAARIQALADPGGVWISDAVRAAIRDRIPVGLRDQGEKRLKNITQPVRVFTVVFGEQARGSPSTPPPTAGQRSNLGLLDDPLVGRGADIAAVGDLVDRHRLVSVVGAAGIGKTRLAYDVAYRRIGRHENGVWWVDLAAVSSSASIAPAIANAANLQLGEGDPVDLLGRALGLRDTLLVLDNCEHLVASVAGIVQAVLAAAPTVRVLATSQEALMLPAEHVYRLDGLAIPDAAADIDAARACGALQLLELRAQAVDRKFAISPANLADAVDLCRRLDGIALAIEMAAARLPLLGLDGVRLRLDQRLRLLRGGDRGAPARHQTLRAMLDGSYSLLNDSEQHILRSLAVFSGNFRLEEAVYVAAVDGVDEWTVVDALAGLVDKSLLQVRSSTPRRYRLLETTRLYAQELLANAGENDAALQRHGRAMATLAREVESDFWRMRDAAWLYRYALDYDDLQAAFDRAAARRDSDLAAPLGNALLRLDYLRNVNPALRVRAEIACELVGSSAAPANAALLWNSVVPHGLIAIGGVPRLVAAQRAVAAWRAVGSAPDLYIALGFLGYESAKAGDLDASRRALDEAARLEDPAWPARRRMRGAAVVAGAAIYREDPAVYRSASRRELTLAEEGGHDRAAAWAKLKLADAALMAGDRDEAIELGRAAVAELEVLDQPSNLGLALANLSTALLMAGDVDPAREAARRALPLTWQNEWGFLVLDQIALIGTFDGRFDDAALILGFTDGWLAANGDRRQPNEAQLVVMAVERLEAAMGALALERLRSEGALLSKQRAELLAKELLATPSSGGGEVRGQRSR